MNIYIPIEVKIRELESKVLLALAAAEKGFKVLIGSKDEVLKPAVDGKLEPGIVHMKSVTPSEAMINMLQKLHENGCLVTALDEEAGIIDEDFSPFGRLRFSNDSLNLIDAMFCWGEFDKRSLQRMFPENKGKFIASGSPRVDLWKEEFHGFHLSKEAGITDSFGKFVLLSSNFGTILNENRIPNMIARMREAGYFDRDPERENHEYQNAAYQTQLIWEFVKLFRHLSKQFPDINFVIRPHPAESIESWKMLVGDAPNIYVLRQGSITPWVLNSVCVIHNGCTTGLEAAFFGKNVIAFRPLPSQIERVVPNNVSDQVHDVDEVTQKLREMIEGGYIKDPKSEVQYILKSRFENFDGFYAVDIITNTWIDLSSNVIQKKVPLPNDRKLASNEIAAKPDHLIMQIKRRLKRLLRGNKIRLGNDDLVGVSLLKSAHKFPSLEDKEIDSMVQAFRNATLRFDHVDYERVGVKSFLFYKKETE